MRKPVEVFLSINNNETVIKFPITPAEITVSSPQSNEVFNTLNGDINIPGIKGLKTISFSSFFPFNKREYSLNNNMFGYEYIQLIEKLRERREPFRLIITSTDINIPVTIDELEYTRGKGDKINFSITFKQFRFVG